MSVVIPIMILGLVVMMVGVLFHFQGLGVVGPEQSFMYQNTDWVTFGFEIAIFGLSIICGSIGLAVYLAKIR